MAAIAAAVLAGVAGGLVVLLGKDMLRALPLELQVWRWLYHPLVQLAALAALLTFGPGPLLRAVAARLRPAGRVRRLLERPVVVWLADRACRACRAVAGLVQAKPGRVEDLAPRIVVAPLTAAAAVACSAMLLTWIPHYLTWPWWIDTDQFAVSALSWHAGVLPYRDLLDFDFPAPIFVLYGLGRVAGWGKTSPFYAFDAAVLVMLGLALAAWSRRVLGGLLPGLVGYATFLGMYLGLDYSLVAQRDWQGPVFAILGIMALEAVPGRAGRLVSAAAAALALAYRPHVVLFFPAMVSALDESSRTPEQPRAAAARGVAWWLAAAVVFSVVAFSPLILAGVFDDFLHSLRYARHDGHYSRVDWNVFLGAARAEIGNHESARVLAALLAIAWLGPDRLRRPSRTWALALLGVFLYKPISPYPHAYLDQPLQLVRAVALAVPVAWVVSTPRLAAPLRMAAVVAIAAVAVPGVPRYCHPAASWAAIQSLARGQDPPLCPPGAALVFARPDAGSDRYRWDDYCRMLDHVRRTTSRRTRVAALLLRFPFPPVNGPTARLTPFPAAGGLVHLWMIDPALESQYVRALDDTPGAVVVWCPTSHHRTETLTYPRLSESVRRSYRPEARFGMIEVWRHVDQTIAANPKS